MLVIRCPFCGDRNESEFTYYGPAAMTRPEDAAGFSAEEWVEYLAVPSNPVGPVTERWWHARGCGSWVTIRRNTATHEITEPADGG